MQIDKSHIIWLILGLFVGVIVVAVVFILANQVRPAPIFISPPPPSATPVETPTPGPLRVYISGEVAHPDVYELPVGAIMLDVVNAAGGFSDAADSNLINLALPLSDGMHVHVPDTSGEDILPTVSDGVVPQISTTGSIIDINKATADELERLPGIGPTIAQRIVDYRLANGPFTSIEDVLEVSGIGPGKYEQIKDLISIQ